MRPPSCSMRAHLRVRRRWRVCWRATLERLCLSPPACAEGSGQSASTGRSGPSESLSCLRRGSRHHLLPFSPTWTLGGRTLCCVELYALPAHYRQITAVCVRKRWFTSWRPQATLAQRPSRPGCRRPPRLPHGGRFCTSHSHTPTTTSTKRSWPPSSQTHATRRPWSLCRSPRTAQQWRGRCRPSPSTASCTRWYTTATSRRRSSSRLRRCCCWPRGRYGGAL